MAKQMSPQRKSYFPCPAGSESTIVFMDKFRLEYDNKERPEKTVMGLFALQWAMPRLLSWTRNLVPNTYIENAAGL